MSLMEDSNTFSAQLDYFWKSCVELYYFLQLLLVFERWKGVWEVVFGLRSTSSTEDSNTFCVQLESSSKCCCSYNWCWFMMKCNQSWDYTNRPWIKCTFSHEILFRAAFWFWTSLVWTSSPKIGYLYISPPQAYSRFECFCWPCGTWPE